MTPSYAPFDLMTGAARPASSRRAETTLLGALDGRGRSFTIIFAAVTCAILIVVLYPWLARYALARPNARSSHRTPTPQGGGIAVVAAHDRRRLDRACIFFSGRIARLQHCYRSSWRR